MHAVYSLGQPVDQHFAGRTMHAFHAKKCLGAIKIRRIRHGAGHRAVLQDTFAKALKNLTATRAAEIVPCGLVGRCRRRQSTQAAGHEVQI